MSSGTPTASSSKKRELSSPEYSIEIKKNKVITDSTTDIESSSLEEHLTAASMEEDDAPAHVTLSDAQLEKIAGFMSSSFQPQISEIAKDSFQSQISDLVTSIVSGVLEGLNKKLDNLEKQNTDLRKENDDLAKENQELQKRVTKLESAVDTAEQYSRRNCLRISGMEEKPLENTDKFVFDIANAIGVDLDVGDVDRSHRLGKPGTAEEPRTKPRDIIVKFATYRMRNMFYKARTLTKDKGYKGVFVNEDLTKSRSKLLYEARRRVKSGQLKSAWSSDGTILIKTNIDDNDVVSRVNSLSDLPGYIAPPPPSGDPAPSGSHD